MRSSPPARPSRSAARLALAAVVGLALAGPARAAAPASAACPERATVAAVQAHLDAAEQRWIELDQDGFRAAIGAAGAAVGCLGEVPAPDVVARYDRVVGMAAFLDRDRDRARLAFVAARRLDPTAGLPTAIAPEGNPLRADHDAIPVDAVTTAPLDPPPGVRAWVDGTPGAERPVNVPALVQLRAGGVYTTRYVWPEDTVDLDAVTPRRGVRYGLVGAALAQGVVAGGLYAGAVVAHRRFEDLGTPNDELASLRAATNTFNAAAIAVGVTATGTAALAIAWPRPR